ncbi:MAG: galactose oxidase [Bacteroidota bacterium]
MTGKKISIGIFIIVATSALQAQENINWVKVTDHAGWQPRDSQGELVYKNHLWILGGWFNSYQPCPRDVWNTTDGKDWNLVQQDAGWKHSDLAMTVVFKDKMWLMGGWYNGRLPDHSSSNEVWCSTDGVNWEQVTSSAAWSPRAYHQAVVFNGKIWVLGGGNYVPNHLAFNDVWCSDDGIHWEEVTSSAPWAPRLWFSSVVYRDRIFVLGGWSKSHDNFGDVWYSKDGSKWTELRSNVIWKARHEHSTFVFQDKIWVAGGFPRPQVSNEVWSLEIPANWYENPKLN